MKTRFLLFLSIFLMLSTSSSSAQDGLGVGMIVGEPTGLVLKKWIGDNTAFDVAAAWSFSDNDSFQIHADYLIHNFSILDPEDVRGWFPVYYGIGGRLKLKDENAGRGRNDADALIGVRVPFGIAYIFPEAPVDIFAEMVPILDLVPDTDFAINVAIGARYYFH